MDSLPPSPAEHGGAAIEYIIVSLFALVFAVGAVTFVAEAMEEKLAALGSELGLEFRLDTDDLFSLPGD